VLRIRFIMVEPFVMSGAKKQGKSALEQLS